MSSAGRFSQVNLTKQKPKPKSEVEQRLAISNRNSPSVRAGTSRSLKASLNKTMTQTQEIIPEAKRTHS
jgi:hypothetical protein